VKSVVEKGEAGQFLSRPHNPGDDRISSAEGGPAHLSIRQLHKKANMFNLADEGTNALFLTFEFWYFGFV